MCWSLSPVFVEKREEAWAIEKKNGHMKVHEKKKKKKDSHALKKNLYRERDHTKGVSVPSTTIHTRAHLDLIV